jgi:histidine kinase
LRRKADKREQINVDILKTMAEEIDNHVDRTSKIIRHMRDFGRKSDVGKEKVQVNHVLRRAVEFFKQQLKLREIEVAEDLHEELPPILADPNRLEQVFVNLLINARDAIEQKGAKGHKEEAKRITLKTKAEEGMVLLK